MIPGARTRFAPKCATVASMANTPESKVKDKIKVLLKKYGAYYTLNVKNGYANNGDPDFDVCHQGFFAGVEAKAGDNKPTALQIVRLKAIRAAGGAAFVVNESNLAVLEVWLADPRGVYAEGNLEHWV